MPRSRRRRRRSKSASPFLFVILVLIVVVGSILAAFIRVTHGLIVFALIPGALLYVVFRGRRRHRIRRRRLRMATDLARLRSLSPGEFEHVVATILGAQGWNLKVVGGAGDEGADLIGWDPDRRRALVQCKRYADGHPVGSATVQLVIGARSIHRVNRVLIVTTSRFTAPAQRLAAREHVELIDESSITRLAAPILDASSESAVALLEPSSRWVDPDSQTRRP